MSEKHDFSSGKITNAMVLDYTLCPALLGLLIKQGSQIYQNPSVIELTALEEKTDVKLRQEIIEKLKREHVTCLIKDEGNLAVEETLQNMTNGVKLILNGKLNVGNLSCFSHVLIKDQWTVEKAPVSKGKKDKKTSKPVYKEYFYYPVKILSEKEISKEEHLMDLAFSAEVLEKVQGRFPEVGLIIDFKGNNHFIDLKCVKSSLLKTIERIQKMMSGKSVFPKPCEHCKICIKKNHCFREYIKRDNVFIIPEVKLRDLSKLRKCKIVKVQDIIDAPEDTINKLSGIQRHTWNSWKSWAQAYREAIIVRANKPVFPKTRNEVLVSVYGDIHSKEKLLIGILLTKKNSGYFEFITLLKSFISDKNYVREFLVDKNHKIIQFFVKDDDEKEMLYNFVKILEKLKHFHIYCYGDYTSKSLCELLVKHKLDGEQEILVRRSITEYSNLRKIIMECIGIPSFSYSIRDVFSKLAYSKYVEGINTKDARLFHSEKSDVLLLCRKWILTKDQEFKELLFEHNRVELLEILYILNALKDYQ